MRRKRDLFLDFTSLLDITLIILFFFIMFSHMEIADSKATADALMAKAEVAMSQAEAREQSAVKKMQETEDLEEQLNDELELVRQANEREAENLEAMLEFGRGHNIKMLLKMENDSWTLNVYSGDELISVIASASNISQGLIDVLTDAGYTSSDTLFCEFILDGSQAGTASAYRTITRAIIEACNTYGHLYYSETDISLLED